MFLFQSAQKRAPEKQAQPLPKYTHLQLQLAVREAGEGLSGRLYARKDDFKGIGRPITVAFGPSPHCYAYRLQASEFPPSDGVGATSPEKLAKDMREAVKFHLPIQECDLFFARQWGVAVDHKKFASAEEGRAIFLIHAQARLRDGGESGRLYIAKHLFEQSAKFENSEQGAVSYASTLSELQSGAARNFSDLLRFSCPPAGLMAGHASYMVAEKELKAKYSAITSILPPSSQVPISLSPHFLRGFVRRDMGFEGILVSDDAGMGAMQSFFKAVRPSLPKEMKALSHPALFFVLSTYAGVNWPLYTFGPSEKKEVRKIYGANPEFRAIFDSLATESLFLKLRALDPSNSLVAGLSLSDLSAPQQALSADKRARVQCLRAAFSEGSDEFEAKFASIASYDSKMPGNSAEHAGLPPAVLTVLTRFSESTDLWNRTGIIDMEFRRRVVQSLTGQEFPPPGKFSIEADWLSALFSSKAFVAAYNRVEWNGAEMRAILGDYCATLAPAAQLSKIERIKPMVPRKIE